MSTFEKFDFARSRGIVWVCDIAGSSKYLNSNRSADDLESFLPRLHWTASMAVDAAGGTFIKWTGDGFLAWFETPLHRELGERVAAVFEAIWHLTLLVNVTQFGLTPERKFRIRHGVTYEQDALLTKITHPGGYESLDLTGRAVVLAFRLSGIEAPFPSIVTQADLVNSYRQAGPPAITFRKWSPSAEDRLKFFKNERWGTRSLFTSGERRRRPKSLAAAVRQSKNAIAAAEGKRKSKYPESGYVNRFVALFSAGPSWCQEASEEYSRFLRDELMGTLKKLVESIEEQLLPSASEPNA